VTEDQGAPRAAKKAAPKAEPADVPETLVSPHVAAGLVAEEDLVEVRTTMKPDQPMKVSAAEALDLESQGLLVKGEDTDAS
jgi:hypothetical protein